VALLWACALVLVAALAHGQQTAAIEPAVPSRSTDGQAKPVEEQDDPVAKEEHALKGLPTQGEYTIIPLPAYSYNRNERSWIGALVPILKANRQNELEDIFAPMYLHNQFVGETFSFNYYGYRTETKQFHGVASYASKVERYFEGSYLDTGAYGGRYILGAQANWFKNAFTRFFGIGNRTRERNESTYTSRETNIQLTAGINFGPSVSVRFTERYRAVRLEQGVIPSLPQTKDVFSGTPGVEGAQILGHRLTFLYDSRDNLLTPTKGTTISIFGELSQNFIHHEPDRWLHYGLEARHLFPHMAGRMIFVGHFLLEAASGQPIPFYERPMLGGENTLRGFGLNRFYDDTALLVNLEERIRVVQKTIFDNSIEFEAAPFVDIGRVTSNFESARLRRFQINPGLGIRLLARPNIVGRLDLAYGKDGENVFVGLDYPF
jgi:hypothetical protein